MSKRRRQSRSLSQTIMWIVSVVIAASMIISLVIVALPSGSRRTPTPLPTWTPFPTSTATPSPPAFPTFAPTEPTDIAPEVTTGATATPLPTLEVTEPPMGPVLPTETPEGTEPPAGPVLPTETPTGSVLPTVTPEITPTVSVTATPSSASLGLSFAVCGDSRDNPAVYRRVLEAVMGSDSEFLLHTGDLVNQGTEAQWQAFAEIMADFTLPFYPVAGNHDGLDGDLAGYLQYSGAQVAHYSFDQGLVHFTLADSHHGGISASELAWLRDDLSATDQPIKMVVLHHPPFDPDGTDHIMAYGNDSFMALMTEQQVDYVFAGHIHAYAQGQRDGVVYTITGGAGAPLYSSDHPHAFHHYLQVTVQGKDVSINVVKI